jgi:hypothetical protein
LPETARVLEPGFSTADAECPQFSLRDGVLTVEFESWEGHRLTVRFSEAAGVKWQQLDSPRDAPHAAADILHKGPLQHRNDEVYEIIGSAWIQEYGSAGEPTDGLRHFRLCFNVWGVLDVLAASMERQA